MNCASRLLCLSVLTLLPALGSATEPLPTGAPAPDFALNNLAGKSVSLGDYKGQIVLMNFWGSYCGPCRKEFPILDQISHQYHGKGVTLVGINVEHDSAAAVDWLKETPVSFPILLDVDSKVSKLYRVEGMPNTVILDRKGNVRYVHRSYHAGVENEYIDQIRALMRE
jgi:peroxiredoxin